MNHGKQPSKQGVKQDTAMDVYDIQFSIFTRLPLKSLLRFQSVSKPWNAIISDIKKSKETSPKNLLLVHLNDGLFEFRDLESPQIVIGNRQFPLKRFLYPTTLCSCDCLVLMKTPMDYNEYALWNPYTNEYRTFVCPYQNGMSTPHGCGLCYDSSDDDYKVILIYSSFCVVYHVKRNYWTKKTIVSSRVGSLNVRPWECIPGISVDGCVFWSLGFLGINQLLRRMSMIIYFDVKSDEFKELPEPDFIGLRQSFRLTSLKGCVGLYGGSTYELDIWIMEQGLISPKGRVGLYGDRTYGKELDGS
ncbi:F-box/kelch-repeat protein At3g23880-like [Lycium ferocissimum]|uniref:F-box/kelch-repeat protein At3g23880-like n=1 Tax=Lycium ferocissimum TaxID=112874 RepID=UPI002814B24E|nr:F-box/kelch-repeat protein At3g23880-like [Lycium ferocissimum]